MGNDCSCQNYFPNLKFHLDRITTFASISSWWALSGTYLHKVGMYIELVLLVSMEIITHLMYNHLIIACCTFVQHVMSVVFVCGRSTMPSKNLALLWIYTREILSPSRNSWYFSKLLMWLVDWSMKCEVASSPLIPLQLIERVLLFYLHVLHDVCCCCCWCFLTVVIVAFITMMLQQSARSRHQRCLQGIGSHVHDPLEEWTSADKTDNTTASRVSYHQFGTTGSR